MPKVSIVIPTYKVEKYIERCARSLFEQTLDSIEYVFVDDCAPDNSIAVMQKVLEEYPHRKEQVKIIRHEVNQGVGAARNHGVAACTGDYIIHCDPDDWVDLNMYEAMYNKAIETDADMVYCDYIAEKDDCVSKKIVKPKKFSNVDAYIKNNFGFQLNSLCTKLYKREIALAQTLYIPDHICMGEDLLRNIQMLVNCRKMVYIPDVFYHYIQNTNSITHTIKKEHFENRFEIIQILEKILPCDLHYLLDRIRAEILWDTLVHNKTYAREFKHLWNSEFWNTARNNILRDKKLHIVKKMFLLLASINYTFACSVYNLLRR